MRMIALSLTEKAQPPEASRGCGSGDGSMKAFIWSKVFFWTAILILWAVLLYLLWNRETPQRVEFEASEEARQTEESLWQITLSPSVGATQPVPAYSRAELAVMTFAFENDLPVEDYPESLVALLERNPETEEFVLNYPLEYGKAHQVDISDYEIENTVPLFLQWDRQWGYLDYGNDVAGLTACGPVCLSMAAVYLTGNRDYSPDYMVEFALNNGYCAPGNGSYWSLIEEGGSTLGLDVTPVYEPDRETVMCNLEAGNLIICVMGPGDFTTDGHFILFSGEEDGKIRINDPNSRRNSGRLWDYDAIAEQIYGMWILRYLG